MKLAFVYAGQGSQKVGMGQDLYQNPVFKAVFDQVDTDGTLQQLCFQGPMEDLSDTRNTQPCMVAFAAGVTALLQHAGIVPQMAAGLSLGEYSALCAAGVWDAQTAVALAKFRGGVMADAVTGIQSGMAAVLGLDRAALDTACKQASTVGVVQIANYNCPGQLVIAGEKPAVDAASALALQAGAKRCLPLAVSGPFHTKLMRPAGDALAKRFTEITFNAPAFPVVFNATAKPLAPGESIPALLERQVQSSVYFEDSIRYMAALGVDTIIEIGPGKVLCGFIKKIAPEIKAYSVEDEKTLTATVAAIQEQE